MCFNLIFLLSLSTCTSPLIFNTCKQHTTAVKNQSNTCAVYLQNKTALSIAVDARKPKLPGNPHSLYLFAELHVRRISFKFNVMYQCEACYHFWQSQQFGHDHKKSQLVTNHHLSSITLNQRFCNLIKKYTSTLFFVCSNHNQV